MSMSLISLLATTACAKLESLLEDSTKSVTEMLEKKATKVSSSA